MASNISTATIDTDYPKPGEDNSTVGFRNNFTAIKENFDSARGEIEDLQVNTARTDTVSAFNGNIILNANLKSVTCAVFEIGSRQTDTEVDFINGSYQTIEVSEDVTLSLTGWPEEQKFAKITLSLLSNSGSKTVSFALASTGEIKRNSGIPVELYDSTNGFNVRIGEFPQFIEVPNDTDPVIVEFWTIDGGNTVFANYVGQFI